MKQNKRQKSINRMLKDVKSTQEVFVGIYGRVLRVKHWIVVAIIDRFVPTLCIPTILAKKYLKGEFIITIHNR